MDVKHISSVSELYGAICSRLGEGTDLRDVVTVEPTSAERKLCETGASEWTNALLNIVLDLGMARGFQVYPPKQYELSCNTGKNKHAGEWLYDACWTRYPDNRSLVAHLEEVANGKVHGRVRYLELACESEWGGREAVIDDFAKLVESRARYKVLFFNFDPKGGDGGFDCIVRLCQALAQSDSGDSHYLLMGWERNASLCDRRHHDYCLAGPSERVWLPTWHFGKGGE
jgi:hypothetical protein